MNRRQFLMGSSATLGSLVLPVSAFGKNSRKLLRFGVVSDVHLGEGSLQHQLDLKSVLGYFDAKGVDAVMVPGDIAQSGLISEFESFAEIWNGVFPNDRGGDGRHVEKLFVTGNHCLDGWRGRWNGWSDERLRSERFHYADNAKKTWERLFHEEYKLIWEKQVKGVTFIGAQWRCVEAPLEIPPVEDYFLSKCGKMDPSRPFFFVQHAHPEGTCHGAYAVPGNGGREARRALAAFPNAVAITGHSHCSIADSRTVWQGEFTSIGAGCLCEGAGALLDCANVSYGWYKPSKDRIMRRTEWIDRGGCVMIVDVFEDHLVLHRHSVHFNEPLGVDWAVPLPATTGRGFDPKVREKQTEAPTFPPEARVYVEFHPKGHRAAKPEFSNVPCYSVRFPPASTSCGRVFDYKIEIAVDGHKVKGDRIVATGFVVPSSRQTDEEIYLVRASELPSDAKVLVSVTPAECFGKTGNSIKSEMLIGRRTV